MSNLTIGDRLSSNNAVQADHDRHNSLTSGHRACQGCGEALASRVVLDYAYKETGGNIAVVNATGCLEVFSCVYPDNSWNVPWIHSLFENAPSVATGMAAAYRNSGRPEMRVIAQGGDGATTDIGFGALSGMFDRNDDVLYVCYDNQAYMNTGVQRSSATPVFTKTATTMPSSSYYGSDIHTGKNVPQIAMAHEIPYVATASIANIRDLEAKVAKALSVRGSRYLQIHSSCPLGWGHDPADSIKVARYAVDSGLFPLYEAENGRITHSNKIRKIIPVDAYLQSQHRYSHLFQGGVKSELVAVIQEIADKNIEKYNLQ